MYGLTITLSEVSLGFSRTHPKFDALTPPVYSGETDWPAARSGCLHATWKSSEFLQSQMQPNDKFTIANENMYIQIF